MLTRLLTFSSLYPNSVMPNHGSFVHERLKQTVSEGEVRASVLAPVPWWPSSRILANSYGKFARVPRYGSIDGIPVIYPRYLVIPKIGMTLAARLMAQSTRQPFDQLARELRPDLVDAHYLYPDAVAATTLAIRSDLPVIATARGSDVNLLMGYRRIRSQVMQAISRMRCVITVSNALKLRLMSFGVPENKVVVIRNGVDTETFRPVVASDIDSRIKHASLVCLSVGNLYEFKGHQYLIHAAARLPELTSVIVGSGPYEPDLRKLANELHVTDRVIFTGELNKQALIEYYSAANIVVLASEREGLPNVVLESLACGTPVIATAVGGIPEVIKSRDQGLLLKNLSVEELVTSIKLLNKKSPTRETVRKSACEYNWAQTTRKLKQLYRRIASDG